MKTITAIIISVALLSSCERDTISSITEDDEVCPLNCNMESLEGTWRVLVWEDTTYNYALTNPDRFVFVFTSNGNMYYEKDVNGICEKASAKWSYNPNEKVNNFSLDSEATLSEYLIFPDSWVRVRILPEDLIFYQSPNTGKAVAVLEKVSRDTVRSCF